MNKRVNTVLFLLIATLFNILVIFVIFLVGFVLLGQFILPIVSPQVGQILLIVLFCGSLALGYVIYNKTLKWFQQRYKTTEALEPIFRKKDDA